MDKIQVFDTDGITPITENDIAVYDIKGNLIDSNNIECVVDTNLIQRAIDGEKDAFNQIYMQSYRYVFFTVRKYISNDEIVYDVMQETFVKVYKGIKNLRSPNAFYDWLTIIAKNTAIDVLRKSQYEKSVIYEDFYDDVSPDENNPDVSLDIASVFKNLSLEDAELLSLVYYDGMRVSQIAKMQGVPATTVYSRLKKAKNNLKSQLAAHGIDKAIYSGSLVVTLTTVLRNIIGTALLSFAIAQQMLEKIVAGKGKKELAIAKVIKNQQKKIILKIASVIVAISMLTSAATALALVDWERFGSSNKNNNNTETITEHHYYYNDTSSKDETYSTDYISDNSDFNEISSSESSDDDVSSGNSSAESEDTPSQGEEQKTPETPKEPDDTPQYANVFGNHPNNVAGNNPNQTTHPLYKKGYTGLVTKQDGWIYYVQAYTRIMRVKEDGTDLQIVYEASGINIVQCLNVIGDTVYFVCDGIHSINVDGTDKKIHTTMDAKNLLVRGTTGWFVEYGSDSGGNPHNSTYSLYQIDFSTGKITTLIQNGNGLGLKLVVDDNLIYANGCEVYARDLNNGNEKLIFKLSDHEKEIPVANLGGIRAISIDDDYNLYIERQIYEESNPTKYFNTGTYKIDLNNPNIVKEFNKNIEYILNFFDYGDGIFWAKKRNSSRCQLLDKEGNVLYEISELTDYKNNVYNFGDNYIYFVNEGNTALCILNLDDGSLKKY